MDEPARVLTLDDRLDLYLVTNGLKPAAILDLWGDKILEEKPSDDASNRPSRTLHLDREKIAGLAQYLDRSALPYRYDGIQRDIHAKGDIRPTQCVEHAHFYIGADGDKLGRLTTAATARNHYDLGLALGYPEDAVQKWCDDRQKGFLCGTRYAKSLADARQSGIEPPSWLAYLGYVPNDVDLSKNHVPQSSETTGRLYQGFVQKHNPVLAKLVEEQFKTRKY